MVRPVPATSPERSKVKSVTLGQNNREKGATRHSTTKPSSLILSLGVVSSWGCCCLRQNHTISDIASRVNIAETPVKRSQPLHPRPLERFSVNRALVYIEQAINTEMSRHGIPDVVNIISIIVVLGSGSRSVYLLRCRLLVESFAL